MNKRHSFRLAALGALALVAATVFIWGMYFLLGTPVLRKGMDIALVLDHGAGLQRGNRVEYRGVDVGSVQNVDLDPPRVIVHLRLRDDLLLPEDTRAVVRGDVFGANTVELLPGRSYARLQRRDTIRGEPAPALTELATELGERAESVLQRADILLDPAAAADLHAATATLPATARELQAAFAELRTASAALRRTAQGAEAAGTAQAATTTFQELAATARAMSGAAEAMERSLGAFATLAERIDRGEGTLGQLLNDPTLYTNMSDAMREVAALASDMRERPRRYFEIRIF